jgi:hypothetical protein
VAEARPAPNVRPDADRGRACAVKSLGKAFFFEKKKQKAFVCAVVKVGISGRNGRASASFVQRGDHHVTPAQFLIDGHTARGRLDYFTGMDRR